MRPREPPNSASSTLGLQVFTTKPQFLKCVLGVELRFLGSNSGVQACTANTVLIHPSHPTPGPYAVPPSRAVRTTPLGCHKWLYKEAFRISTFQSSQNCAITVSPLEGSISPPTPYFAGRLECFQIDPFSGFSVAVTKHPDKNRLRAERVCWVPGYSPSSQGSHGRNSTVTSAERVLACLFSPAFSS